MADEYIRRDAAMKAVASQYGACRSPAQNRMIDEIRNKIRRMPAADVAEVVHGQWISFLDGDHIMPERYYRCSRCGRVESRRQPYCHCGAKMDGAAE
nr:MAG TPA: DNA-directed RNA polymerase [Caudoviricetes sp.]